LRGLQKLGIALALVAPAAAADLPAGAGRELLVRSCIGCHKSDEFAAYRHTRVEYRSIVRRMGDRGAQASAKELDEIADYLAANFPKVEDPSKINVNKASANELEERLELTAKEAAAIVSYRERHGDFRAIGDLFLIYGVDGRKIQAAKDKLSF
jgi:competence ComEA-like helix-hairpin-helix protein